MIQKNRIVKTRGIQDIENSINRLTKGKPYQLKNWTEKRDFDANGGTLGDLANVFATLISDLIERGIIQK